MYVCYVPYSREIWWFGGLAVGLPTTNLNSAKFLLYTIIWQYTYDDRYCAANILITRDFWANSQIYRLPLFPAIQYVTSNYRQLNFREHNFPPSLFSLFSLFPSSSLSFLLSLLTPPPFFPPPPPPPLPFSLSYNQVNCPIYIVHVMSKSAAQAVIRGKERGQLWWLSRHCMHLHWSCDFFFLPIIRLCSVWRAHSGQSGH